MASLLISLGVGGSLGTIIGVLKDPVSGFIFKFATSNLSKIAKGEHLNAEEKEFIKNYNSRKYIHNGIDYTHQMRVMSFSPGMR